MPTAVIIGGRGQSGQAIGQRLVAEGWAVTATTSGPLPDPAATPGIRWSALARDQVSSLTGVVKPGTDLVVDIVAFTPGHAEQLIALGDRIGAAVVLFDDVCLHRPRGALTGRSHRRGQLPRLAGADPRGLAHPALGRRQLLHPQSRPGTGPARARAVARHDRAPRGDPRPLQPAPARVVLHQADSRRPPEGHPPLRRSQRPPAHGNGEPGRTGDAGRRPARPPDTQLRGPGRAIGGADQRDHRRPDELVH